MKLEIYTGERNYYLWSVFGLICFSGSLLFAQKNLEINDELINQIAISSCTMGVFGVFLTLGFCFKMCLRVGIIPGIYHSTLCVPTLEEDKFTFKITSGFYSAVACGVLSFLMFASECLVMSTESINSTISLHLQSYTGVIVLIYCYYYGLGRTHEFIGNLFVIICFFIYVLIEYKSYSLISFAAGGGLMGLGMLICLLVRKAQKTLDRNSVTIVILLTQGTLGVFLLIACYLFNENSPEINRYVCGTGTLSAFGIWALCYSKLIEMAFLFIFPTTVHIITSDLKIVLVASTSLLIGFLIVTFGDIPFRKCKGKDSGPKSPLHSPLL